MKRKGRNTNRQMRSSSEGRESVNALLPSTAGHDWSIATAEWSYWKRGRTMCDCTD